jgi:hypothetical protein
VSKAFLAIGEAFVGGTNALLDVRSAFLDSRQPFLARSEGLLPGSMPSLLRRHDPAMVDGVRRVSSSDVALAITGIAGPTGGTETKPVGLV